MKITVYKNTEEYLIRDYDLTIATVQEIQNALFQHCELVNVDPCASAIAISREYTNDYDHIIKRTTDVMSMGDVAVEILKYYQGRK